MYDFFSDFESFTESWWPYLISVFITVISATRFYFGGTYCPSSARIDGKTVIITGGARGIGLATAKQLTNRGANVILAVRNVEKGLKALNEIRETNKTASVQIKLVDISDLASIRNFAEGIKNEHDKIDVLINNAGIIGSKAQDEYEPVFTTNYLGPFLLTHLMLPLLAKSDNGRVINVSALAHYNGKLDLEGNFGKSSTPQEAFAKSKLALTVFTKYIAQLHKSTNITFNSVSPGLVRNTGHWETFSSLNSSFLTKLSVWPWVWLFMKTPKQGCQSIVYLTVEPSLHKVTGCYFSDCEIKEPAEIVNDFNVARCLYEKTCKIVALDSEDIKN
ncbi:unnamed protein product [Phyllotreta striolata]|uniref:Uncharacterized protein n=1 Tax=Phyllotreta striolata TaxID=444603 RepID=A0A9N9TY47_PHYSR|nr:unnamed protein product [Phyllotreta striolata]